MKRTALLIFVVALVAVLGVLATTGAQEVEGNLIGLDHPYAAFLESRAYAAEQGATAEFNKMEWVVIDPETNMLYMAMSDITGGLTDGEGAISVDENRCGIVYAGQLDENYNLSSMAPLVVGGPFNPDGGANRCALDNISNPDALWLDGMGRLWIGEDTGNHENNAIWVYNPADGSMKRFGYVPLGAEITGLMISETGTVFFSNQHPDADNIYPFNAGSIHVIAGFNANTDDFEEIAVPEGDAKKIVAVAAGELQTLGRAGDPIPGSMTGDVLGGVYTADGELQMVINDPDGLMWLPNTEDGTQGILYANFEARPGGVARLNVIWEDGVWSVVDGDMVDFLPVGGTWNNCGSSVTPWGTGLTSEEYEPFAGDYAQVGMMSAQLGYAANPYDYGWIVELEPDEIEDDVAKRYAMGRKSNENSFVAADGQTVYFGDDGSNVVLFKFVAEVPGDLACGTLYAGAVTQTGGTGADHVFEIEWIELGFACDEEIEAAIRELDPVE